MCADAALVAAPLAFLVSGCASWALKGLLYPPQVNPYGLGYIPYGMGGIPYGMGGIPYGMGGIPYGMGYIPYGIHTSFHME
jgi:hypothetical protein